MSSRLFASKEPPKLAESRIMELAHHWFCGVEGSRWLEQEQPKLIAECSRILGRYRVHMGPHAGSLLEQPEASSFIRLGTTPDAAIRCHEFAWPIAERCLDAVILQHALEFSRHPQLLLQEAARSLRPGGHLLIVGINPWSLWRWQSRRAADLVPHLHYPMPSRLKSYLSQLGFMLELHCYGGYSMSAEPKWLERHQWPVGGYYLITARKLVSGLIPTRTKWRRSFDTRLAPLSLARDQSCIRPAKVRPPAKIYWTVDERNWH
ncbi:methyltransferase family protein [Azomonas agilis]|uniref:Methyltransferase family protein n=1 Tax=Azomonas agilis TaxID=116849 RepID=A0A562I1U6_9GAMM|nr:methyltransferase domain-containing protein [Azomonas agilis]TWH65019.1 methyltransferase family protein [Azomonas agilis]